MKNDKHVIILSILSLSVSFIFVALTLIVSMGEIKHDTLPSIVQICCAILITFTASIIALGTQSIFQNNAIRDDRKYQLDKVKLWYDLYSWMIDSKHLENIEKISLWRIDIKHDAPIPEQLDAITRTRLLIENQLINLHLEKSRVEKLKGSTSGIFGVTPPPKAIENSISDACVQTIEALDFFNNKLKEIRGCSDPSKFESAINIDEFGELVSPKISAVRESLLKYTAAIESYHYAFSAVQEIYSRK